MQQIKQERELREVRVAEIRKVRIDIKAKKNKIKDNTQVLEVELSSSESSSIDPDDEKRQRKKELKKFTKQNEENVELALYSKMSKVISQEKSGFLRDNAGDLEYRN
jgi:hypothetical protein